MVGLLITVSYVKRKVRVIVTKVKRKGKALVVAIDNKANGS